MRHILSVTSCVCLMQSFDSQHSLISGTTEDEDECNLSGMGLTYHLFYERVWSVHQPGFQGVPSIAPAAGNPRHKATAHPANYLALQSQAQHTTSRRSGDQYTLHDAGHHTSQAVVATTLQVLVNTVHPSYMP